MVKDPSLKKLRNKLLFINLISLTLVVTLAFSIIYITFYNRAQLEIEKAMQQIPRNVLDNAMLSNRDTLQTWPSVQGDNEGLTIRGEVRLPVDFSKSVVVNIASEGTTTVFSMLNIDEGTYIHAIESVLKKSEDSGVMNFAGRTWKFSAEQQVSPLGPYYSIVFLDIEDTNRSLRALALSLVIIGFIAIGVIFMVSIFLANRSIRPVEESVARQRRFVADASHELKTPIAIIAANAEAASGAILEAKKASADDSDDVVNTPDVSYWIGNIADETTRMNGLVEGLFALAKTGEKATDYTSFDLISAVNEESNRVEAFLFEKNISFDTEVTIPEGESTVIVSDKAKVQAILSILLENAVKYTSAEGHVIVTVGKNNVSVSNTGAFIPPEQLTRLFDRFYRSDLSRNSETGGHGIGLSIAKEIADTIGAKLKAESVLQEEDLALNTFVLSF